MDPTANAQTGNGDVVMESTPIYPSTVSHSQPLSIKPEHKATTPMPERPPPSPSPSRQSPYVPQFSAATSFILNRMKNTTSNFNSTLSDLSAAVAQSDKDAYEEFKTKLAQSMSRGTTLPDPPPLSSPGEPWLLRPSISNPSTAAEPAASSSLKRKRAPEQEQEQEQTAAVDFAQTTMPFPAAPESTSVPLHNASNGVKQECSECHTSVSFEGNQVVICHRCGVGRHQQCWSPAVPGAEFKTVTFTCERCQPSGANLQSSSRTPAESNGHKVERVRRRRLAALPAGVAPVKPELVGFGAGAATDHARAQYFQSMNKTDLLNILSFCDQLQPQLIVDIMVSVSKRHPHLPMFASPDLGAPPPLASSSAGPRPSKQRVPSRPSHGRSLLNSKAKQKIKTSASASASASTGANGSTNGSTNGNGAKNGSKKQAKKPAPAGQEAPLPPAIDDEGVLPAAWPRAGQGMYAKLVPEVQDRSLLKDDNDEGAFSHFMVSNVGKQIIEPV